ncbi:MAG: hypothetical protein R3B90_06600 [Planctomycetaceae bacterium]
MEDLEGDEIWSVLKHCDPELQAEIFQFSRWRIGKNWSEIIDRGSLSKIIEGNGL